MRHDFIACIFAEMEALTHGTYGVAAVGVTGHILVDALHADFEACAAVREHVAEVGLKAVVGASFDRDANALRVALL